MRVVLLGPQRRPTVDAVAAGVIADGAAELQGEPADAPVATITAGWQEREGDDAELGRLLGGRDVNLRLYQRWLDVAERDQAFAAAERTLAEVLDQLQEGYLLRLDHALQAVYALQHSSQGRGSERGVAIRAAITAEAIAAVAELDEAHLRRVDHASGEFYARLAPHDRPVIAAHRAEVSGVLAGAAALVLAGGHVGVLADVLHLFNVAAAVRSPVIAWSAGAMALTERIVLFHDRSAHGPGHPEVYGTGLSLLPGLVALPHAGARLLLDDAARMAVFARRFAPAYCVPLEEGTRIDTEFSTQDHGAQDHGAQHRAASCPPGTVVLGADGHLSTLAPVHAGSPVNAGRA